jgi:hypothetical protein
MLVIYTLSIRDPIQSLSRLVLIPPLESSLSFSFSRISSVWSTRDDWATLQRDD